MNCNREVLLSKAEFVEVIDKLHDASDLVDKVNALFFYSRENVECDFCNAASMQISHETLVVDLLQRLMQDQSEMISYFIYELDYGEEYEAGKVTELDGTEIVLSSSAALYDFLIKEYAKDDVKTQWEH